MLSESIMQTIIFETQSSGIFFYIQRPQKELQDRKEDAIPTVSRRIDFRKLSQEIFPHLC